MPFLETELQFLTLTKIPGAKSLYMLSWGDGGYIGTNDLTTYSTEDLEIHQPVFYPLLTPTFKTYLSQSHRFLQNVFPPLLLTS